MPFVPKLEPDSPPASVSPASPINDLIFDKDQSMTLLKTVNNAYETEMKFSHHMLDATDKGNEPDAIHSLKVRHENTRALYSHAELVICQPMPNDIDTGLPIVKGWGDKEKLLTGAVKIQVCLNEHFKNDMELAPQAPSNPKPPDVAEVEQPSQEAVNNEGLNVRLHSPGSTATAILLVKIQEGGERPGEEAISKAEASAHLHLPRSSVAPMQLMHKLVEPMPTCLPCLSPKLEHQLHRKPPDCGERMR